MLDQGFKTELNSWEQDWLLMAVEGVLCLDKKEIFFFWVYDYLVAG